MFSTNLQCRIKTWNDWNTHRAAKDTDSTTNGSCELEDLTFAEQDESCTLLESLRFGEHQKNIFADRIQSLSSARIVSGTIE